MKIRRLARERRLDLREVRCFDVGITESLGLLQASYGIVVVCENGRRPIPVGSLARLGSNTTGGRDKARGDWRPTVEALNELLGILKGAEVPNASVEERPTREEVHGSTIASVFLGIVSVGERSCGGIRGSARAGVWTASW